MHIAWNSRLTYLLPLIAKSLAANSGNATAITASFARNEQLQNYPSTGTITPNQDTHSFLDFVQASFRRLLSTINIAQRNWSFEKPYSTCNPH